MTDNPDELSGLFDLVSGSAQGEAAPAVTAMNRIVRQAARLRHGTEAVAAEYGLRAADLGILWVLDRAEGQRPMRVTDLANILRVTPGGVSKRLDRLEASGHVQRAAHGGDARAVHLLLTPAGRDVARTARAANWGDLGRLSPAEWRQLDGLLAKLGRRSDR
ncbi:MAG: MarR family transcriptional regulator [Phenylobacterium sp.]